MGHYLPFYIRYAAHFRFDVIWLDLEHRAMSQREVQSILAMCQQHDIDCMVRAPTQGRTRLYRYLEDGATGFMIPFVANADIARHIVEAVKFPPQGNRGLDGAGLDADFGIEAWNPGPVVDLEADWLRRGRRAPPGPARRPRRRPWCWRTNASGFATSTRPLPAQGCR